MWWHLIWTRLRKRTIRETVKIPSNSSFGILPLAQKILQPTMLPTVVTRISAWSLFLIKHTFKEPHKSFTLPQPHFMVYMHVKFWCMTNKNYFAHLWSYRFRMLTIIGSMWPEIAHKLRPYPDPFHHLPQRKVYHHCQKIHTIRLRYCELSLISNNSQRPGHNPCKDI